MARKIDSPVVPDRMTLKPTSVRLTTMELAELRDVAAGMGLSVSECARRAILTLVDRRATDVERATAGDLVSILGALHTELRVMAQRPTMDPLSLSTTTAAVETACSAIVSRYSKSAPA